jgi:hypothetical protein
MSVQVFGPGGYTAGDHAPGDEPAESAGHWLRSYVAGLGFATILTIASSSAAATHLIWGPAAPVAPDRARDRPDGRPPDS